jgi:hypothetical protein
MRFTVLLVLVGACTSSDLDPAAQGACSGLAPQACAANPQCQPAFVEDGWSPGPMPLHCLAVEGDRELQGTCPQDHDSCRATHACSPIFFQRLGPTDGPVGDPTYSRCDATAAVLTGSL